MSIKAILFDLDGTLLPMDHEPFVKGYLGGLASALAPHGYSAQELPASIFKGMAAMVSNDGTATNEEVFWRVFTKIYGDKVKDDIPYFDKFYQEEFDKVSEVASPDPLVPSLIKELKARGIHIILATNPVFPAIATIKRTRWAGLSVEDFELFTSYENSRYCKPNLKYYEDILKKTGLNAEECLMVGNDVDEDMITEKLGMKVFLITKHIINKSNKDISIYPCGDFADLSHYIKKLIDGE